MDEPKVFDISKPKATASARPVILSAQPAADPMVRVAEAPKPEPRKIELTSPDDEPGAPANTDSPAAVAPAEPATAELTEEPKPQITNIPVSAAPVEPVASEAPTPVETPSVITPSLPGAPASDFSNVPKFGELQPKVDAHPLFSGQAERRIKVRHLPRFVKPLTALLILLIGAYLVVDSGVVAGASHLPFHVFKQKLAANAPTIQSSVAAAATTKTQPAAPADPYADWLTYSSAFNYSFKYPNAYASFNVQTRNDQTLASALKSQEPANDPTGASGPITILDYKTTNQPVSTYTNGPTITLGKTGWVVQIANKADPNKYKVGDTFKDISTVYSKQKQPIYTLQINSTGELNYSILFVSRNALHEIVLPTFAISTNGVANDQTAYDKMYQMLRDSITATP